MTTKPGWRRWPDEAGVMMTAGQSRGGDDDEMAGRFGEAHQIALCGTTDV